MKRIKQRLATLLVFACAMLASQGAMAKKLGIDGVWYDELFGSYTWGKTYDGVAVTGDEVKQLFKGKFYVVQTSDPKYSNIFDGVLSIAPGFSNDYEGNEVLGYDFFFEDENGNVTSTIKNPGTYKVLPKIKDDCAYCLMDQGDGYWYETNGVKYMTTSYYYECGEFFYTINPNPNAHTIAIDDAVVYSDITALFGNNWEKEYDGTPVTGDQIAEQYQISSMALVMSDPSAPQPSVSDTEVAFLDYTNNTISTSITSPGTYYVLYTMKDQSNYYYNAQDHLCFVFNGKKYNTGMSLEEAIELGAIDCYTIKPKSKTFSDDMTAEDINSTISAGGAFSPITYSRNIKANWNTVCLPFATKSTEDTKYYTIQSLVNGVITLQLAETLPAGKPALVYTTSNTELNITGSGTLATAPANASGTNRLVGTFAGTTVQGASDTDHLFYGLSANTGKYVKVTSDVALKPFRAYIECENTPAFANLRGVISDSDETTAIEVLDALNSADAQYYDMNGRKTNALRQGMNIIKKGEKTVKIYIK